MSRILGSTTGQGDICTMSGSINASVLSIPISGSGQEGLAIGYRDAWNQPYIVKIDNELILVNSSSTTTLTVAPVSGSLPTGGRGYQGTTPSSHTSGAKVQFSYLINRATGNFLSWMTAAETKIRADSGVSDWHYGAWRRYVNGATFDNDWLTSRNLGRAPCVSWGPQSGNGAGSAQADANALNAGGTNSIKTAWTNLGNDWLDYQNTYASFDDGIGQTFFAGLVHEANLDSSGTAPEWRNFYQAVFSLWINMGIQLWEGHNVPGTGGPVCTQQGMCIFTNLSWGSFGQPASLGDTWWPISWTWGNDNIQMASVDFYNRGGQLGQPGAWRSFADDAGDTQAPSGNPGFRDWARTRTAQLLAGTGTTGGASKHLIHGILECETGEGRIPPATSGFSTGQYASLNASWTNPSAPTTSQSPSAANWILDALRYIKTWPELYTFHWFDNAVNSITDWQSDTTQQKWDATVVFNTDPIWDLVAAPPPPTSATKTFVIS